MHFGEAVFCIKPFH